MATHLRKSNPIRCHYFINSRRVLFHHLKYSIHTPVIASEEGGALLDSTNHDLTIPRSQSCEASFTNSANSQENLTATDHPISALNSSELPQLDRDMPSPPYMESCKPSTVPCDPKLMLTDPLDDDSSEMTDYGRVSFKNHLSSEHPIQEHDVSMESGISRCEEYKVEGKDEEVKIKETVVDGLVFFSRNFEILIKGGTLSRLIDELIFQETPDSDYVEAFLMTYRNFISAKSLLDRLVNCYRAGMTGGDAAMLNLRPRVNTNPNYPNIDLKKFNVGEAGEKGGGRAGAKKVEGDGEGGNDGIKSNRRRAHTLVCVSSKRDLHVYKIDTKNRDACQYNQTDLNRDVKLIGNLSAKKDLFHHSIEKDKHPKPDPFQSAIEDKYVNIPALSNPTLLKEDHSNDLMGLSTPSLLKESHSLNVIDSISSINSSPYLKSNIVPNDLYPSIENSSIESPSIQPHNTPSSSYPDLEHSTSLPSQKRVSIIRIRVGNVLKHWITDHFHDFSNDANLLENLQQVIRTVIKEKILANTLERSIHEQLQINIDKIKKEVMFSEHPPPVYPAKKGSNIKLWHPIEVARQICLLEQPIFQSIHPKEFLNQAWNKRRDGAPNVSKMISFFNSLSKWVSTVICECEIMKERVEMIKKFMMIVIYLRHYNNFDAMQSVASGLDNSSIHRLSKSWEKVNKTKTYQHYVEMVGVMSTENNLAAYRRALVHADPPIIPYLGAYLTDLIFIEEGNPSYLTVQGDRDDIINFEKNRKIAVVIKSICTYQQTPYNFHPVEVIADFLSQDLPYLSDRELYNLSRKIEPRDPNHPGVTKVQKVNKTLRNSFSCLSKDLKKVQLPVQPTLNPTKTTTTSPSSNLKSPIHCGSGNGGMMNPGNENRLSSVGDDIKEGVGFSKKNDGIYNKKRSFSLNMQQSRIRSI